MTADLHVNPSTLEVDYDNNVTDLYQAITDQNWERAAQVCRLKPVQAATWVVRHYEDEENGEDREIMWRFLPLHSACARQPPSSVVAALIRAYPDAPKCVDDQGMYALHYACGNQAARDVIRQLLTSFPEAAKIPDPRGMLPIHYLACWGPSSVSVLDMLLIANRDVADAKDAEGNTPLDLALEGDYPEKDSVVSALQKWLTASHNTTATEAQTMSRRAKMTPRHGSRHAVAQAAASVASSNTLKPAISPDEIKRLNEIIRSLRSEMNVKEREWERRANGSSAEWKNKYELLQKESEAREQELEDAREQLETARDDLEEKAKEAEDNAKALKDTKTKLQECKDELKGLRLTLGDLMDKHESDKKKNHNMSDRLGSLAASLESMMEQQASLSKTLKASYAKRQSTLEERTSRLKDLIAMETELVEDQNVLSASLNKQNREMEAIAAVIAAARE